MAKEVPINDKDVMDMSVTAIEGLTSSLSPMSQTEIKEISQEV